jgi:hypothetical protein
MSLFLDNSRIEHKIDMMIDTNTRFMREVIDLKQNYPLITFVITPSETCSTKNSDEFVKVLDWLKLDNSMNFIERYCKTETEFVQSFAQFNKFNWLTKPECEGYPYLCEYLTNTCSLIARDISGGDALSKGLLFNEKVYSLRDRLVDGSLLRSEDKIPVYQFQIRGRSDIVVLDDDSLGKSNVKFAVEVKTVKAMEELANENQALREAFLQMLGLNIANCYKSPAVVLTNLCLKNYVLYLTTKGDPELSLRYSLNIMKSKELGKVLYFANELSNRNSITSKLGTFLTPQISEEGDENYGNVELFINNDEGIEELNDMDNS